MLLVQIADRTHPPVTLERWNGAEGLLEAPLQAGLLGLRAALQWASQQRLEAPLILCEQPRLLGFLEGELAVPTALRPEVCAVRALRRWSRAEMLPVRRVDVAEADWVFTVCRAGSPFALTRLVVRTGGAAPRPLRGGLEWSPGAPRGDAQEEQEGARDGAV